MSGFPTGGTDVAASYDRNPDWFASNRVQLDERLRNQ